jgi:hypothetical protein
LVILELVLEVIFEGLFIEVILELVLEVIFEGLFIEVIF